ncbi:unnamed protein product [Pieris brassicae]|uniref:Uncharacterized protein n=1 Tax=Pieris brassicae TaxID=7116 RepID=A0A9P0XE53_PIEBR|nr:unnamed protein product [Pieris brassicae]
MPLVESLEPAFLDRVVADLFPLPPDIVPPCMAATVVEAAGGDGEMAPEVSDIEMEAILTRLKARKKAPGKLWGGGSTHNGQHLPFCETDKGPGP